MSLFAKSLLTLNLIFGVCACAPEVDSSKKPVLESREVELQKRLDEELLLELRKSGDNLDLERKIDHMAFFPTAGTATEFINYLESHNYTIDRKYHAETQNIYIVQFSKITTPKAMQQTSLVLLEQANGFSGTYDGWSCYVVE